MTAFEAMFPTHATLATVGTSPCAGSTSTPSPYSSPSSPPSAPSAPSAVKPPSVKIPAGISLLKYVIVYDPIAQEERAIIFDRTIQHSTMVPLGHRPVSAGSLVIARGQVVVASIGSETLHLDPRPQDKEILTAFLSLNSKP